MLHRSQNRLKNRQPSRQNAVVSARVAFFTSMGKRERGVERGRRLSSMPPEDWHEPKATAPKSYKIIVQQPGSGYRHVVTPDEIRARLSLLPASMLESLQVVQLSRMTRKKKTCPCYGMQWGQALYLYPVEESLIETFYRPPTPLQINEARMYGGRWTQSGRNTWQLVWSTESVRDFYLNNILIHELGHLLDNRNTSYTDRERFAEWFAIEHGYKPSRRRELAVQAASKILGSGPAANDR